MRGSLTGVRRRLEHLTERVQMQDCDQLHVVHKASIVWEDAPPPQWPEDGAATHCACGLEIEYRHIVRELHWQDEAFRKGSGDRKEGGELESRCGR